MIDFDTDGAGVDGAGFAGVFAFAFEFGRLARTEEAEGIEITLEISALAVSVENALAFGIGALVSRTAAREPPLDVFIFEVIDFSY